MAKLNVYLLFPTSNMESTITSITDGEKFIEDIRMLIDRADCEKNSTLYYEDTNIEGFLDELKLIEDFDGMGNFGVVDFETGLYFLLREASAKNVDDKPHYNDSCVYMLWDFDSKTITENFSPILKEMTEKILTAVIRGEEEITEKLLDLVSIENPSIAEKIKKNLPTKEKSILLNIHNAFSTSPNFIAIFKDCRTNPNNEFPVFAHLYFASNFKELNQWFEENRLQRNYNMIDNRHIEAHPDYRKGKSPILGGLGGKEHIASLLENAIGDQRETDRLFNFDAENNCYIRFEFENDNPQNLYHGYHLVKPQTHEIDEKAVKEIPYRVIQVLEYRKNLNS
ncbi:MAG: hypothetical protein ACPG49_06115 [Chitinophagales bacterium]